MTDQVTLSEFDSYNVIFGIWLVLALYGCIAGGIFTAFEAENEKNILVCVFYPQIAIYENLEDEIDFAGIIIVLAVITLFLLPCNILILALKILALACRLFWTVFKHVFKKKPVGGGGEDGN